MSTEPSGEGRRVELVPSDHHVRVEVAGNVLADTRRAQVLHETGLPPRWYVPMEDVRQDMLVPSDTVTRCPYKGTARYWSVRAGDTVVPDAVWAYPDPIAGVEPLATLVAFYDDKVDLVVEDQR